jgi:hypothetical protein
MMLIITKWKSILFFIKVAFISPQHDNDFQLSIHFPLYCMFEHIRQKVSCDKTIQDTIENEASEDVLIPNVMGGSAFPRAKQDRDKSRSSSLLLSTVV